MCLILEVIFVKYFKIIFNDEFIGVGTSLNFRKIQKKHGILLACDESEAQYIECNSMLYRAEWMVTDTNQVIGNQFAQVIEIDKDEYDALYNAVESGEEIEIYQDEEETVESDPVEEITIDFVKDQKIKEMSKACNQIIEKGVDVMLSDDQSHHFSLTTQDQLNLISLQTMIISGQTSVPYHADNEPCRFFSTADIQAVLTGATKHITYHESYFNSLKAYINSLDEIETVGGIEYGVDIPDDYQTEVLQTLLSQKG